MSLLVLLLKNPVRLAANGALLLNYTTPKNFIAKCLIDNAGMKFANFTSLLILACINALPVSLQCKDIFKQRYYAIHNTIYF
jgi:hypothetical protein